MIDINKLFNTYSNNTSLNEGHYEYMLDKEDFKQALKEYTELLLKEAADKALINPLNHDGYSYGSQDTIYIEPNENSDYFNFGGTCVVDKDSITSIINDINFD